MFQEVLVLPSVLPTTLTVMTKSGEMEATRGTPGELLLLLLCLGNWLTIYSDFYFRGLSDFDMMMEKKRSEQKKRRKKKDIDLINDNDDQVLHLSLLLLTSSRSPV